MKVFGHGELKHHELALRYSLGLPGVSLATLGMDDEAQIDQNVRLAQQIRLLSEAELDTLLAEARGLLVCRTNPRSHASYSF